MPKHALADIPQELPDELFSQMMSALATNHNADLGKVVGDFIQNSPQLIAAIALMGGTGGAIKARQDAGGSQGQTQADASVDEQPRSETQQPSPENPIPFHTTLAAADSGSGQPASAQPSTPPLSVEQSQKLIHNVMNRPPEQRGHPTTQADLAQAQWVVREQVRKLESQKEPLSAAQKKGLADAKSTLARLTPSVMSGLDELQSLPSLAGKTKAEIEAELIARGYTSTPANSGGTVWTKPGNDATTSAVRIDPAKIRTKPKGYADEVPHVHKETVPSSKVDSSGNYPMSDATTHNDSGNPSTDKRDTHISGGH